MIEPTFNEFSAVPLCADGEVADAEFKTLVGLIQHLEVYGIKRIRYENSINDIPFTVTDTLGAYCSKIVQNRNASNASKQNEVYYLYGRIKPPYIGETEWIYPDNLEKAKLIDANTNGVIADDPLSVMVAHFLDSFTIGFDNKFSSPLKLRLTFAKNVAGKRVESYTKEVDVICVTSKDSCLQNQHFIDLLASQDNLPVPVAIDKKTKYDLPKHHGSKECMEHGDELLKNPYVRDILSTRAFNGGASEYITKVNPDGSIEVRLYWTNDGYGLLISTSGQDIVQTTWIAKRLDKQYGKKR